MLKCRKDSEPIVDAAQSVAIATPKKRATKRKTKSTTSKARDDVQVGGTVEEGPLLLINQEDDPVPIDGSKVAAVEEDEHPEALAAAHIYGDGCGVGSATSAKSTGGRKRKSKTVAVRA